MIVLGLILVLLAAGAILVVSLDESTVSAAVPVNVFDYTFQPNHLEMFLAGAATAGVLLVGLAMIGSGSRRARQQRKQLRESRVEADGRVAELEAEKRRLERKLHDTDQTPVSPSPGSPASTPAPPPAPGTAYVPKQEDRTVSADDHLVAGRRSEGPRA
jgi:hypothetical protein